MSVLAQLRDAGLTLGIEGDKLSVSGPITDELRALARANKAQVMADLAEEAYLAKAFGCRGCAFTTSIHPWPGQPRRCVRCGRADPRP